MQYSFVVYIFDLVAYMAPITMTLSIQPGTRDAATSVAALSHPATLTSQRTVLSVPTMVNWVMNCLPSLAYFHSRYGTFSGSENSPERQGSEAGLLMPGCFQSLPSWKVGTRNCCLVGKVG
jgi:hypothetical protein